MNKKKKMLPIIEHRDWTHGAKVEVMGNFGVGGGTLY